MAEPVRDKPAAERRETSYVGKPLRRVDGRAKVTGATRFADDLTFPRMCFLKLVRSVLRNFGVKDCTVFDDPAAALAYLEIHGVDCVITDLIMPHMNGFELTEEIRSSVRHRQLPVILVTARESEADRSRGIQVGANAYILKSSFDQRNLLETIAQLL